MEPQREIAFIANVSISVPFHSDSSKVEIEKYPSFN